MSTLKVRPCGQLPDALNPCPCGQVPTELHLDDNGCSYAYASGNCCNEWSVEFRTGYYALDSNECMQYAIEAWNAAPRGTQ